MRRAGVRARPPGQRGGDGRPRAENKPFHYEKAAPRPGSRSSTAPPPRNDAHPLPDHPAPSPANFVFQRRRERVNWRALVSLSVDAIVSNLDVTTLQEHLSNVTFCDLEAEEMDIDPNFVKLFQLAQLMLEYVLFVQEELATAKEHSDFRLRNTMAELKQVRQHCGQAQKEARRRKQVVTAYQKMCDLHGLRPFQSPYDEKAFISLEHLLAHCERRHPENRPFSEVHALYGKKQSTGKVLDDVYAELEQLRTELARTREQAAEHAAEARKAATSRVEADTERIKLQQADQENLVARVKQDADRLRQEQEGRHQRELAELREALALEIREIRTTAHARQKELAEKEDEIANLRHQLGHSREAPTAASGPPTNEHLVQERYIASLEAQIDFFRAELDKRNSHMDTVLTADPARPSWVRGDPVRKESRSRKDSRSKPRPRPSAADPDASPARKRPTEPAVAPPPSLQAPPAARKPPSSPEESDQEADYELAAPTAGQKPSTRPVLRPNVAPPHKYTRDEIVAEIDTINRNRLGQFGLDPDATRLTDAEYAQHVGRLQGAQARRVSQEPEFGQLLAEARAELEHEVLRRSPPRAAVGGRPPAAAHGALQPQAVPPPVDRAEPPPRTKPSRPTPPSAGALAAAAAPQQPTQPQPSPRRESEQPPAPAARPAESQASTAAAVPVRLPRARTDAAEARDLPVPAVEADEHEPLDPAMAARRSAERRLAIVMEQRRAAAAAAGAGQMQQQRREPAAVEDPPSPAPRSPMAGGMAEEVSPRRSRIVEASAAGDDWQHVNREMKARVVQAQTAGAADSLSSEESSDDIAVLEDRPLLPPHDSRFDQGRDLSPPPPADAGRFDPESDEEEATARVGNTSMGSVSDPYDSDEALSADDDVPPLQAMPHRRMQALSPVAEGADELNVSTDTDDERRDMDDLDALMDEMDGIPTGMTP